MLTPDRAHPGAYTLRVDGTEQSYVDPGDPTRLEFDYVARLADLADCLGESGAPLRVVHVGGAAMTVPRYVAATRPRSSQLVLEPDAALTAFVRQHLPLPPRSGIRVRDTDGRTGLAQLRDGYAELVVVDAFAGARVPPELTTLECWAEVRRVLTPTGVAVVNLTDRGPFPYARRVLAGVADTWANTAFCAEPATLKGRRFGNVLVVGSAAPLPLAELAARAGRGPYPYRVLHGARLAQVRAGAPPFADAAAEPSPAPPDGLTHFG